MGEGASEEVAKAAPSASVSAGVAASASARVAAETTYVPPVEEPVARIAALRGQLGDDWSFESLKKRQKQLIGARDGINARMRGHPGDYQ